MEGQEKSGMKTWKKILLALLAILLAACVGFGIYVYHMDYKKLGRYISVFGTDVSGMTVEEAVQEISESFGERNVLLYEEGDNVLKTSVAYLGYSLDQDSLTSVLKDVQAERMKNWTLFPNRVNYTLPFQVNLDEETEVNLLVNTEYGHVDREASQDSAVKYDEKQKKFIATKAILGNQIDDDALVSYVDKSLRAAFEEAVLGDSIEITFADEVYKQPVTAEDSSIQEKLKELNGKLDTYRSTTVTYTLGSSTEVIDGEKLEEWIQVKGDTVSLDQAAVKTYVEDLATKYNSIYTPRTFTTTGGNQVTISDNEYGFQIDQDAEYKQLLTDLGSGTAVSRDPIYAISGWQRNGTDDLAGSYIEVSIDAQHLWLYKDGALVTETDIVSGKPTAERATYRGAWPIAYKASPYTLTSDVYGYNSKVTYWMPFVYGQGLHDASWRSSFGGSIYKSNGSHGCVNLPTSAAKTIYENIDGGYPIIIY